VSVFVYGGPEFRLTHSACRYHHYYGISCWGQLITDSQVDQQAVEAG
jgi:hypothetical protein